MQLSMRPCLEIYNHLSEEMLRFARQLGVGDVAFRSPHLPGDRQWEFKDLLNARKAAEDAGLRLAAIENIPFEFYDKVMVGQPGRDEQIEHLAATIRNIGAAGIPVLHYHWMINYLWRTSLTTPTRGGAAGPSFDMELVKNAPFTHGRQYTDDEVWANYEYFIKAIAPAAEEAGVTLALHPDDPPVPAIAGVARIFRNLESFKRVLAIVDSPAHSLDFCIGSWSSMGENVVEAIRYFGGKGKIALVHFRDVKGTPTKFQEVLLGEGNLNMFEVMKALKEVGYTGVLITDHVPHLIGDSEWDHRGNAWAIGYMSGLLAAVNS